MGDSGGAPAEVVTAAERGSGMECVEGIYTADAYIGLLHGSSPAQLETLSNFLAAGWMGKLADKVIVTLPGVSESHAVSVAVKWASRLLHQEPPGDTR